MFRLLKVLICNERDDKKLKLKTSKEPIYIQEKF